MSVVQKSVVSTLKTLELQVRGADTRIWKDKPLSEMNKIFMDDLYTMLTCIWYDVSTTPELLNSRWVSALNAEPVDRVISCFKDLDDLLIKESLNASTFNQWRKDNYPTMGQVIAPLLGVLGQFFATGAGLKRIRTALRYITRANFPDPLGLEEEAIDAWFTHCCREAPKVNLDREAEVLSSVFPKGKSVIRLTNFIPKFGDGVSADRENRSLEDRYANFVTDPLLDYAAKKCDFPTTDLPRIKSGLQRKHLVSFAPKRLDVLRVISHEMSSLMFYQLGLHRWVVERLGYSQWRNHIDLGHAELNQDLAWEGSLTGEYATIDLERASDYVRYDHVCRLLQDTCLLIPARGFRSRVAVVNGEEVQPTYYGPMGCGCTFVIETIVFAAIVDAVMRRNSDKRAWRVYGDDIVCPSDRVDEVIDRLLELGFTPNLAKSFTKPVSGFRESCGGDYFYGEDVHPIYIPRKFKTLRPLKKRPQTIVELVSMANELFDYKYARLRLITSLESMNVIYTHSGEIGLWSPSPSNYHLKERWNPEYQTVEYLHGQLNTKQKPSRSDSEDIRLFEYFRANVGQSSVAESTTMIGRSGRPVWTLTWGSPSPGWPQGRNP